MTSLTVWSSSTTSTRCVTNVPRSGPSTLPPAGPSAQRSHAPGRPRVGETLRGSYGCAGSPTEAYARSYGDRNADTCHWCGRVHRIARRRPARRTRARGGGRGRAAAAGARRDATALGRAARSRGRRRPRRRPADPAAAPESTRCATRRPWSATASTPPTRPEYASHNDLGTAILLAAMHATGVRRLVLASSMVVYGEGRYHCPAHGVVRPAARRAADLAAGRYDPTCPRCDATLSPGLVPEDAPLEPHSTYAATKLAQEHLAGGLGPADRRLGLGAALPQRLRPADAARHPVRRGRVDLPVGTGRRAGAPGPGGRTAAARLRARHRRRARPTCWP